MISLTMTFPIAFSISGSVGDKETNGGETNNDKSCEECWRCGAMRSSRSGKSKPQRWISVEVNKLTMDHGRGRGESCCLLLFICHILFHASASRQTRSESREHEKMCFGAPWVLDAGSLGLLTHLLLPPEISIRHRTTYRLPLAPLRRTRHPKDRRELALDYLSGLLTALMRPYRCLSQIYQWFTPRGVEKLPDGIVCRPDVEFVSTI